MKKFLLFIFLSLFISFLYSQEKINLIDWENFWTREDKAGKMEILKNAPFKNQESIKINFSGEKDWSLNRKEILNVKEGEIYEISIAFKILGKGSLSFGVTTFNENKKSVEWTFGGRTIYGDTDWNVITQKFVVPQNIFFIKPRITGSNKSEVWINGFSIKKIGTISDSSKLKSAIAQNNFISVELDPKFGTINVVDKRSKKVWSQKVYNNNIFFTSLSSSDSGIIGTFTDIKNDLDIKLTLKLEKDKAEFLLTLSSDPKKNFTTLNYPQPFTADSGSDLIIPLNEGISYPADDPDIKTMRLAAYSGHGICMAFFGASDGKNSQIAILETPNDASIRIERIDSKLVVIPEWESEKTKFGYDRKIRYAFFDNGGYVSVAKRYRDYAKSSGNFKTLTQKKIDNPNVDKLIGAVNIWCWDQNAEPFVKEMQKLGIKRILWSNRLSPDQIDKLNTLGVLTGRYDIYQDAMNPEKFDQLNYIHSDWTSEAWKNNDLILDQKGEWVKGWEVIAKDGTRIPCGVLCDKQAIKYTDRISIELKKSHYQARFIDTTTASNFRECWNPAHPMTRSECRFWRMELLKTVSEKYKMVTGSETGHDAAVPFVHYFEGMLSLGPYRISDAGRNMQKIIDEAPLNITKFQVGEKYRIPLWELVYHDSVVAMWYWGDYNNKLPSVWSKRDLFNILYATPPLFMFDAKLWQKEKGRFAESYKKISAVARSCGYSEMTVHKYLNKERSVQQTIFDNGVVVTVNFSDKDFKMPDGRIIKSNDYFADGIKIE